MAPLVSVLIPAYNAERWIADAVRSATSQTWQRLEVIAVDDGSSDATLAVLQSLASPRVQVLSQKNRGASAARNLALRAAQGEFIQWLDADDLLSPSKIARQLAEGREDTALYSSAWGRFRACPARARFERSALWTDLSPAEWAIRKFRDNSWMAIESWLVSRRLAEAAGPWDETLSMDDDGEYFSRVMAVSSGIRFVADSCSYVRRGPAGSLSQQVHSPDRLASQLRSSILQVRRLRALDSSEASRSAILSYLQRLYPLFYPDHPALIAHLGQFAQEFDGILVAPQEAQGWVLLDRLGLRASIQRGRRILPRVRAAAAYRLEKCACWFLTKSPD